MSGAYARGTSFHASFSAAPIHVGKSGYAATGVPSTFMPIASRASDNATRTASASRAWPGEQIIPVERAFFDEEREIAEPHRPPRAVTERMEREQPQMIFVAERDGLGGAEHHGAQPSRDLAGVAPAHVREAVVQVDGNAIVLEATQRLFRATTLGRRDDEIEIGEVAQALLRVATRDRPPLDDDGPNADLGERAQT